MYDKSIFELCVCVCRFIIFPLKWIYGITSTQKRLMLSHSVNLFTYFNDYFFYRITVIKSGKTEINEWKREQEASAEAAEVRRYLLQKEVFK